MDREEISGVSRELEQVLWTMEKEEPRVKAWKTSDRETGFLTEEDPEQQEKGSRSFTFLHPSDGLAAAFFIPVIILVVIFAQRGIFPFGDESFLRTDMYHQYAPFFSEFQHKLKTGGSLLYSWDIGMGVNFAALYAYYLASPINWLLLFCPKSLILEFMTYLIVVKTGLCGLTFAWYLRRHEGGESRFGVGYFGIFYALSGYMAAYSWNIMWLDCILLFPLIMLGLERLVHERKGLLYGVCLGLSILSNYYISIMICLFLVICFVCLLILKGRQRVRDFFACCGLFAFYSLAAGALAGAVLLPEIRALQATASGEMTFPQTFEAYFSILDMVARHLGNVQTEIGLDHWPNIYCGVAVLMFFLLYLACPRISVKEKTVYCGLLLLFYASFSINVLNFIWHGFHYPNSLPCRQSFIYIFLMLFLCFRAYCYLEETPKKRIAVAFWAAVCFVLLAQKLVTDEAYHFIVFYAAILLLALYTGLIYYYRNPAHSRTAAALLTLGLVAVEAAVNTTVTSVTTTSRTAYVEDNEAIGELTGSLWSEHGFYRVDRQNAKTKNDGAWLNFPSASLFSSVASADMTEFFKTMGCEGSTNAYSIVGSTPLVDSLFSIQYAIYQGKQENPRLSLYSYSGDLYLYENAYTLPLGFLMPDIMETGWKRDLQTPVEVQNDLASVLDAPPVLEAIEGEDRGKTYHFTAPQDGEYYICLMNRRVKAVRLTIGEETDTIENVNRGFLLETGFLKAGETVTVENKDSVEDLSAGAYLFKEEGLAAIETRLSGRPFLVSVWEDDRLEGTAEGGEEGGTLFLSIPYDEGWKVTVDGKPVTARKVLDAFLGVEIGPGRHSVSLEFYPRGLREGMAASAAAAVLLLAAALLEWRMGKRRRRR